ncbi:MAG: alpha/beta hydrolase [Phycisphaerales bacterium]
MSSMPGWQENMRIRVYGKKELSPVVVLHGGPGAAGESACIARGLSEHFRVFEPWQRISGDKPLSVAIHVSDLHELISSRCANQKPALVGESWGAMLALAYSAAYPENAGPIVLVGCGTFDEASRAELVKIRKNRILAYIEKHLEYKSDLNLSFDELNMKYHEMTDVYESIDNAAHIPVSEPFDIKAHTETFNDMLRCQKESIYPQSFTAIKSSVLMVHGEYDPHPGKMIRDSLKKYIPQLEYYEFGKCGHKPAIEKFAKDDFFKLICNWLKKRC